MGLGAVKAGIEGGMSSQAAANKHIEAIVEEMESARSQYREIAALTGHLPTAGFVAEQARMAGAAGISEKENVRFQTAFQAYAGQYIGTKLPPDQAERLQRQVAAYSVTQGLNKGSGPEDAARLLGTIVDKAKPGASDEAILGQYARSMKAMQLAPGYTGPLLGQLSEVVAESVGPNGDFAETTDASILLRAISQRNPDSASAYTRAVLRGLRRARAKPELAKELGLAKGMDVFQQIEAVGRASAAATAHGEDEGAFLESHGFAEIRQYGGIQTAINAGVRGGAVQPRPREMTGVDAATGRRVGPGVTAQTLRQSGADYLHSQEGGAVSRRGQILAAQRERAGRYAELQRIRREESIAQQSSGELERGEGILGGLGTMAVGAWMQEDRAALENRAMVSGALRDLKQSARGRAYLGGDGASAIGSGGVTHKGELGGQLGPTWLGGRLFQGGNRLAPDAAQADAANGLRMIREESAKQTELLEQLQRTAPRPNAAGHSVNLGMPDPATRFGEQAISSGRGDLVT